MKDNPLIRKVYVTGEKQEHPKIWWPVWRVLEQKLAPILNLNQTVCELQIDLREQVQQLTNMASNQSKVISQLYKETAELTNRLAVVEFNATGRWRNAQTEEERERQKIIEATLRHNVIMPEEDEEFEQSIVSLTDLF